MPNCDEKYWPSSLGVAVRGFRRLLERGQEVAGVAEQRGFGGRIHGNHGLGDLRQHRQRDGGVKVAVHAAAGRIRELNSGLALGGYRAQAGAAGHFQFSSFAWPSEPSAAVSNKTVLLRPSELTALAVIR